MLQNLGIILVLTLLLSSALQTLTHFGLITKRALLKSTEYIEDLYNGKLYAKYCS